MGPDGVRKLSLKGFFSSFKFPEDAFFSYQKKIFALMSLPDLDHRVRMSSEMPDRILAMCGLSWNKQSSYKARDWSNVATAVLIESVFIGVYREDMLKALDGANAMRKDLRDYFLSIAMTYHWPASGPGGSQDEATVPMTLWMFADNIEPREVEVPSYRHVAMQKKLMASKRSTEKARKTLFTKTIGGLQNNKYLMCSDPGVPAGTLETSAHHLIAALAKVRRRSRPPLCLSQLLTCHFRRRPRLHSCSHSHSHPPSMRNRSCWSTWLASSTRRQATPQSPSRSTKTWRYVCP